MVNHGTAHLVRLVDLCSMLTYDLLAINLCAYLVVVRSSKKREFKLCVVHLFVLRFISDEHGGISQQLDE
jgi:hypothetical protein